MPMNLILGAAIGAVGMDGAGGIGPALIDYNYGTANYTESGVSVTFASRHTFTRAGIATLRTPSPSTTLTDFSNNIVRRDSRGVLAQRTATNLYPTSTSPTTQTISLNAGTYSIDVVGTGSCTLSGGPTGTATDGAAVNFTLGSTTSVTFTLAGTVTHVNLISFTPSVPVAGEIYATEPIKNVTTSTARSQEILSANIASLGLARATVVVIARSARYKAASGNYLVIGVDANNGVSLRHNSGATNLLLVATVGGVTPGTFATIAPVVSNDTRFCAAFTMDNGQLYGSLNGSAAASGSYTGSIGALTTIAEATAIGGANPSDAFIERVIVYGGIASTTALASMSQLSAWP